MNSIYIEDNRFVFRFPFNQKIVDEIKTIEGSVFNGQQWTAPINLLTSTDIIIVAERNDFIVEDDVAWKLKKLSEAKKSLGSLNKIEGTGLPNVPYFGTELHPFQRVAVEYISIANQVLLCYEKGLDAMTTSLAAIQKMDAYPCCIITQPSKVLDWKAAIKELLPPHNAKDVIIESAFPILCTYTSIIVEDFEILSSMAVQELKSMGRAIEETNVRIFTSTLTHSAESIAPALTVMGKMAELGGWKRYMSDYLNNDFYILEDKLKSFCYIQRSHEDVQMDLPMYSTFKKHYTISNREEYVKAYAETREIIFDIKQAIGPLAEDSLSYKGRMFEAHEAICDLWAVILKGKINAFKEWIMDFSRSNIVLKVFIRDKRIESDILHSFRDKNVYTLTSEEDSRYGVCLDIPTTTETDVMCGGWLFLKPMVYIFIDDNTIEHELWELRDVDNTEWEATKKLMDTIVNNELIK